MMVDTLFTLTLIIFFLAFFYFLMNMGKKEERNTGPFLVLGGVILFMFYTLRIYPLLTVFSQKNLILMKAAGGGFLGFSVAWFLYSVFKLDKIRKPFLMIAMILAGSEAVSLSLYSETENISVIHIHYAVMGFCAVVCFLFFWIHIFRYKKYRDRNRKFILISLFFILLRAAGYMVFEGLLNKAPLPVYKQPSIILLTSFFLYTLFSNLRHQHELILDQNTRVKKLVSDKLFEFEKAHQQKMIRYIKLAHETKTPLTLIRNNLQRMVRMEYSAEQIRLMKDDVDRLIGNVVNLLDIEKIERGEFITPANMAIDISALIERKAVLFSNLANDKNLRFSHSIAPRQFVRISPLAVDIIVNNLLDNAMKFSRRGGKISIALKQYHDCAVLRISDNGIGMNRETMQHIFNAYYQAGDRKNGLPGIGIGLYLVKEIVEASGGSIEVKSVLGKGSGFIARFPLSECESVGKEDEQVNDVAGLMDSDYDDNRANVLVVDDNPALLALLRENISAEYNFFFARNGLEALERLKRIPKPDLILSDIIMDKMDGIRLFGTLSDQDEYNLIPFIFLTGEAQDIEKVAALRSGVADVITKPFSVDVLMAKIHSITGYRRRYTEKLIKDINQKVETILAEKPATAAMMPHGKKADNDFGEFIRRYNLSPREAAIARLIARGYIYRDIADKLELSANTVETYRKRIFKKCSIQNRTELLVRVQGDHSAGLYL